MKVLIILSFLVLGSTILQAQNSRADYQLKIEAAQKKQSENIERFLNTSLSIADRKAAFARVPAIQQEEQVKKGRQILKNNQEDSNIRILSMMSLITEIANNNQLLSDIFAIIKNENEVIQLRRQALQALISLNFTSVKLSTRRSEFHTILRELIKDDDKKIRNTSFQILCASGDEYAQRKLLEGLKDNDKALLDPATSIRYLGYDIHAGHLNTIHQVLLSPPNEKTKIAAIRQLGSHAESRNIMVELMKNNEENIQVRKICAATLSINDQEKFEANVTDIILNEKEDESLRAYSIRALTNISSQTNTKTKTTLKKLQTESNSPKIRSLVDDYFEKSKTGKN